MTKKPNSTLSDHNFSSSRRRLLRLSPLIFLAGCDIEAGGKTESFLHTVQRFNDWVQTQIFSSARLSPEVADSQLTPEDQFRVNSYGDDDPDIDIRKWHLEVKGLVKRQGSYSIKHIAALPKKMMNTKHCCVEGWSMNVKWGGTPLRAFLESVGADLSAKYIAVQCGDGYYTGYDMPSALHPQTLLCYEAYGKPLTLEHGAPLRITMPVKLGYKSAKWVNTIIVTNEKPGGYWEDQGYDWFAGL